MLAVRKLMPEECFVLMGMTEEDCKKCRALGISDTQLYKQARKFDLRTSIRKNIYKFI